MGDGDRTRDIRCHRPTLYQLSYAHHRRKFNTPREWGVVGRIAEHSGSRDHFRMDLTISDRFHWGKRCGSGYLGHWHVPDRGENSWVRDALFDYRM